MENNFIEKIKIAELDPSKVYFMQIENSYIPVEQLSHIAHMLDDKFKEYGVRNILLFTPPITEIKFTEVKDGE